MEHLQITQITRHELEELVYNVISNSIANTGVFSKDESQTKDLFNIQEASEFLSLKKPTLYQKVSKREIPFLKRSKRLYFKREDLIEYLEKGRVKSVSEIQEEADNLFKKRGGLNNGK